MSRERGPRSPFSLDPGLDREGFESMGREVLTLAADWLEGESRDPVLQRRPGAELREDLADGLPQRPRPWEEVRDRLREDLLPHCRHNGHPRFWAYVSASAEPVGILADLLASSLNQNVTAWRSAPGPATLERQVIAWLDEAVGFDGGHGLLVGGGSAANLHGLCLALRHAAETHDAERGRMVVYLSEETHLSIAKAARILGIGDDHLRALPADNAGRLRCDLLRAALEEDRRLGNRPACIVASAGTANTGAIDPLEEVADVAARHAVWLHVDGAYGAPAAMTEDYAWMRSGLARADSMSLDPHKWLYAPLDVGCLLTRHPELSARTFSTDADYVHVEQSEELERFAFFDHGLELSRRFRALKLWMMLQLVGLDRITERIAEDVALRQHLDDRVLREESLESLGSELSICCFRHRPVDRRGADALNRAILDELNGSGHFLLSPTRVRGDFALRVCIVNFRTRREDLDELVDAVLAAARTAD